jgi:hypothetical protein
MKSLTLALLSALALAVPAAAQTESYVSDKEVFKSSAPIVRVASSISEFTLADAPLLAGSDYVIIQSTYAGGRFAYSFEAGASTVSAAGARGALFATKEPGGTFWEARIRRWHQNLRVYALFLDTANSSPVLNVLQAK